MKLATRRFPDTIIRRREMPGMRNAYGEWVPGETADVEMRAHVLPLKTEDADLEAGAQVRRRLKLFVLPFRSRVSTAAATLLHNGNPLTLHGSPLTLFAGFETMDADALAAAFEAAGADRVIIDGVEFVVESSQNWRSYSRATILRET